MFKVTLSLFLLLIFQVADAQSTQVTPKKTSSLKLKLTYRLSYQPDSTDSNKILKEDMLLFIGDDFSKFQSLNRYLFDSLVADVESKGGIKHLSKVGFNASTLPKSGFKYEIYKNYPKGSITVIDKIEISDYAYSEPLNLFRWQITNEKATIAGYACQKATTVFGGRQYVAWFTNEVPVSDGPYKFNGLPGLIVKVNDTRNHYVFELSSLKKATSTESIAFPNKQLIGTSKKEFAKGAKDFNENIAARLGDMVTLNDPDALKRAEQNAKKKNNPIELIN
ncbi:GLPGLI family protein [Pontibacter burrus]|uniref:GLPGLI family protein n=1 Tax=Pontibacter burrus TaxID=2704466 RepID=A0A6B3LTM5_9BACT|nr:GLPGLI family protein [Pontibacter burrus]NEM98355.1 GLPGLI family protein [Pontibacter burrus]